MTPFIILFLAGLLTGIVIRPLLSWHKHDWEVIFHDNLTKGSLQYLTFTYSRSLTEAAQNFVLDGKKAHVTYKRCRKCKECHISIDTVGRTTTFDFDVVKSQLDKHIALEKEKADQALLDALNARIGLTSPEVSYNPEHERQRENPPQQVHHRGKTPERS